MIEGLLELPVNTPFPSNQVGCQSCSVLPVAWGATECIFSGDRSGPGHGLRICPALSEFSKCKDVVTHQLSGVGLCDGSGWCSLSQLELPVAAEGSGRPTGQIPR